MGEANQDYTCITSEVEFSILQKGRGGKDDTISYMHMSLLVASLLFAKDVQVYLEFKGKLTFIGITGSVTASS